MATRTQNVLGEKGRRIRELTSVVQKRFNFAEHSVELYAEKVATRGLCAIAQAESLRYKLVGGLAVRRACYGVLRFIMESGAKGMYKKNFYLTFNFNKLVNFTLNACQAYLEVMPMCMYTLQCKYGSKTGCSKINLQSTCKLNYMTEIYLTEGLNFMISRERFS